MKIGIFGGSFDPIHLGHIRLADYIVNNSDLDSIWLMVSPLNPLKADGPRPTSAEHRLEMARLATKDFPNIQVNDIELSLPVPSYTYNTLCELSRKFPQHQFKLIVGADNILSFKKWKEPDKILTEYGVIVYPRPGYNLNQNDIPAGAEIIQNCPCTDISSTELRNNMQVFNDFIHPDVIKYIIKHNLYK